MSAEELDLGEDERCIIFFIIKTHPSVIPLRIHPSLHPSLQNAAFTYYFKVVDVPESREACIDQKREGPVHRGLSLV